MRYVHWLKIDGYSKSEDTASQFLAIENYLKQYQNASAILYQDVILDNCTSCKRGMLPEYRDNYKDNYTKEE